MTLSYSYVSHVVRSMTCIFPLYLPCPLLSVVLSSLHISLRVCAYLRLQSVRQPVLSTPPPPPQPKLISPLSHTYSFLYPITSSFHPRLSCQCLVAIKCWSSENSQSDHFSSAHFHCIAPSLPRALPYSPTPPPPHHLAAKTTGISFYRLTRMPFFLYLLPHAHIH